MTRPRIGFAALLIAEVIVFWLANLPTWLDFPAFAFGDLGASLTIQDLVDRGARPGVDFAHHYGLLPIAFGRFWFGMFSRTPGAYYASMGLIEVWMAWSLVRVAEARRIGWEGRALLVVGLPFFIQSCYPNLAHALEAGLICQGLAEQALGRRGVAMAFASLAVLAKPSLGFAYGLVLLVMILYSLRGQWSWRDVFGREALGPAILTGVVLIGLLTLLYGFESVVRTTLPLAGAKTYRAGGFGFFFGSGREFWRPSGVGLGYYLGTVVGFWLAGSITLAIAGLVAVVRGFRDVDGEFVVTSAIVHTLFVFELFGHSTTWVYDSYVLGLGLAVAAGMGRIWRRWTWVLIAIASLGLRTPLTAPVVGWREHVRTRETLGLWCDPRNRAEWIEVRALIRGQRTVILAVSGCSERFFPSFEPAESVFLVPGLEDEPEVARKADRIAGAHWVVLPKYLDNERLTRWPAFASALNGHEIAHDGAYYRVYVIR